MSVKTFRNKWIEFTPTWSGFALMFDLAGYFDNRLRIQIYFFWGKLFIHLPFRTKYDECDPPSYGIYYDNHAQAFVIKSGRKTKFYYMPWSYDWIRTSNLRKDGNWEHETNNNRKDFWKDEWKGIIWHERYDYTYILEDGEVQKRIADIKVCEMEWRQKWFKWTRIFARVRKYIDIDFNAEIGERSGSWKGGVTGCSYEIKGKETPLDTLRRMEKERKFA